MADIPPTRNGHELDLVVEIRLPIGADRPPVLEGKQFLEFESGGKGTVPRAQEIGTLDVAKAQLVDGRWIVPGSVRIFTTREYRFLTVVLSEKDATGFQLIFPSHPGTKYEQWSSWQPDTGKAEPWPSTRTSYRYRIQERIPVVDVPPPDPFLALSFGLFWNFRGKLRPGKGLVPVVRQISDIFPEVPLNCWNSRL